MSLGGSENLSAGFNITKNINGFDHKFDIDQTFEGASSQNPLIFYIK